MNRTSLSAFAITILIASGAQAAESDVADGASAGLTILDWAIIGTYGLGTLWLGWYYGRRQKSTKEYFVGTGRMNPLLIGVSLFATLLSTISYLSMPGEALGKGPVNMMAMFAFPLVFVVVGYGILPLYMKQRVTSAYELLEERLGKSVRLLGAFMFITLRLFWMSLLIFLTAKALTIMLGVGEDWIPGIAIATGLVAVTYTSMGGLRAVVVTDFVQTMLLFGGAWLVIATISYRLGGFGWIPTEWNPAWDTQPVYSLDPATRVTVIGTLLNYTVWYICTSGGDQTSVQRFMATSDAKAARKAFATQLCVSIFVAVTLGLVGFAMLAYFEQYPERLGAGLTIQDNADAIFPHFIAFHLPPGISGLVVAAMFAAAMSSVDSGVNSISAVLMTDVVEQAGLAPESERAHMWWSRGLAFLIGVVVVMASSLMGEIPGNITSVTTKTANLLTTPIFGLFFFAIFVPFATPRGVWVGAFFGTTTAVLIAFSGPIFGFVEGSDQLDPISFQWIAPVAFMVNATTGSIASLLLPRARRTSSTKESS
jgi:SSS family solute:Na+ symporter